MPASAQRRAWSAAALSALLVAVISVAGCRDRDLRGYSEASHDAQSYLVVDDDNGGGCGTILVDKAPWPHPIHTPGPIAPGDHVIECGGEIAFSIKPGTIFHFEYWGP